MELNEQIQDILDEIRVLKKYTNQIPEKDLSFIINDIIRNIQRKLELISSDIKKKEMEGEKNGL